MKTLTKIYTAFMLCLFQGLCTLSNNRGELSLRALYLDKDELRKKMQALWTKRDKGSDWTKEDRNTYEELRGKAEKLESDIKLRTEFVETFKSEVGKDDRDFAKSTRQASLYNIIRSLIFKQTNSAEYRDDFGRVNEVMTEHHNRVGGKYVRDGFTSVPESALAVPPAPATQKRTDILSSGATGGDSLISEIVRPDLYTEGLYEKTWMQRAGVPILSGLEGDLKIPKVDTKPSFSWIAENTNFAEQDLSFDDVTLSPLYAGAIQVFSLGVFLRSAGSSVMRFVQAELMRAFQSGLEKSFIQDDGTANKPKGLYSLVQATSEVSALGSAPDANTGGPLTYAKALETEAKITSTNQDMPLTWLVSDAVRLKALQVLKFAVNGASQLFMPGSNMLADRPAVVTNSIQDNIARGTGTTSKIVLFQPQSLVLGRWLGGIQLQVNTQGAEFWKAGKTAVRVIDVCNMVSRRDSDIAVLKEIDS